MKLPRQRHATVSTNDRANYVGRSAIRPSTTTDGGVRPQISCQQVCQAAYLACQLSGAPGCDLIYQGCLLTC